jgi:DNA-binding response OmpR family regulator
VKSRSPRNLGAITAVGARMDGIQRECGRVARLRFDEMVIDEASREVFVGGRYAKLTRKEFDLLCVLAQNAGQTLTRLQLLRAVWGPSFEGSDSTLTVHVRRLRSKIEDNPNFPRRIKTVWSVGYMFQDQ